MKKSIFIKNSIFKIKSNILTIIIISFLLTMLFYVSNSSLIVINYINDYKTKSIDKRELIAYKISTNSGIEDIKKISNVSEVVNFNYSHVSLSSDKYENIELIGVNENELNKIKVIKGSKNIGKGNIVCPVEFIPINDSNSKNINLSNVTYNGNSLIDTSFIGIFNKYKMGQGGPVLEDTLKKEFKIVGTYNSKEYMNSNNVCYSTIDDIEEIIKFASGNKENDNAYAVIVDNIDNLDQVKNQLEKMGFNVNYKVNSDVATITILIVVAFTLFLGVIFIIAITIKHNIKRDIVNKEKEILLYKAIGYNKNEIIKVYNYEYLLVFAMSIFISLLSSVCSFELLKHYSSNILEFKILNLSISPLSICILIIIGLIFSRYIITKSIKKIIANNKIVL